MPEPAREGKVRPRMRPAPAPLKDVQGRPDINMRDEQGRRRAVIGVEQDGHAFASFTDEGDRVNWRAP